MFCILHHFSTYYANGERVNLAAGLTGVLVGVLNMVVRALPGLATGPQFQVLVVYPHIHIHKAGFFFQIYDSPSILLSHV